MDRPSSLAHADKWNGLTGLACSNHAGPTRTRHTSLDTDGQHVYEAGAQDQRRPCSINEATRRNQLGRLSILVTLLSLHLEGSSKLQRLQFAVLVKTSALDAWPENVNHTLPDLALTSCSGTRELEDDGSLAKAYARDPLGHKVMLVLVPPFSACG